MVNQFRQFFLVFLSFIPAWFVTILPVPQDWRWVIPKWLTLTLIYWVFALPQGIGMITGWLVGLVMDVLTDKLLGQHALAMVLVVLLARLFRVRFRVFSFWQRALMVLVLVGLGDLILLLIQRLSGYPAHTLLYWIPTLSSVLFWPWFARLLQWYERKIL
jgi:rod shape-determining protein MreD